MGEVSASDRDPVEDWRAMAELSATFDEFSEHAAALSAGGRPPQTGARQLARAPMIIDTDIGGDPDDAVALAVAALTVPELALVITSDEYGGQRARFARYLLDLVDRPDVPVVSGADLGNVRLYCVDGLIPPDVASQPTDIVTAVEAVFSERSGPIRWVGMGPLSNLSALHTARPELVERMIVTQMGGAIAYRDPTRAEHNFRVDPAAARHLLSVLELPTLVISDVTFNTAMEITPGSPIYRQWADVNAPGWAQLLKVHLDRWATTYPGSMQHDGLTLAAALLWPGVRFARERVVLDELGRMNLSTHGVEVKMSVQADYADFMAWLAQRLSREQAVKPTPQPDVGSRYS